MRRTPPPRGDARRASGSTTRKYALPTLAELDAASGDHPLQFFHTSGHNVLVNSVVLARAGVDEHDAGSAGWTVRAGRRGTADRALPRRRLRGGRADRGRHRVARPELPHDGDPRRPGALRSIGRARAFRAAGLTCVADAQVTSRELRGYRAGARSVVCSASARSACRCRTSSTTSPRSGWSGPFGDDHLSIGHLKIYADGSLTGGTAAFSPALGREGSGSVVLPRAGSSWSPLIEQAWSAGWRIGVHAQGDEAIAHVLDGFEQAATSSPRPDARPRIEHAGLPTSTGVKRMASPRRDRGEPAVVPARLRRRVRRVAREERATTCSRGGMSSTPVSEW